MIANRVRVVAGNADDARENGPSNKTAPAGNRGLTSPLGLADGRLW